jgi:hypothetical protein
MSAWYGERSNDAKTHKPRFFSIDGRIAPETGQSKRLGRSAASHIQTFKAINSWRQTTPDLSKVTTRSDFRP